MPTTTSRSSDSRALTGRAAEAKQRFQVPVLIAAVLVVPVIYIEQQFQTGIWSELAYLTNWGIWAVFLIEYVTVVRLADDKWHYTKTAWLDVIIILTSFPLLGELLASTRLLRFGRLTQVLRVLRLVRLAAIVSRGGFAIHEVFRKRGLGYVLMLLAILAVGAGGVFVVAEDSRSIADGLWWAIVTITTVGYGDIAPVTAMGRLAGAALMVLGLGLVAVLTASVAAHFVGEDDAGVREGIDGVHQRLDEIERLLTIVASQPTRDPYDVGQSPEPADSRASDLPWSES